MNKFKRRYSGKKSRKFWKRINSLPHPQRDKAYTLGVVLQNAEYDILRQIEITYDEGKE